MRTIYIADDGTKFDDGIACANYEQGCKKRDLENYYNLPLVHFTYDDILEGASDEIGYDIVHIRNEEDLEILNKAYKIKCAYKKNEYVFNNSYIGKNIALFVDFEGNLTFYEHESTLEVIKDKIERTLDSITHQLRAFEN